MHYQRWRKLQGHSFVPLEKTESERFWESVDKTSSAEGCWLWTGSVHPSGYATFFVNGGSPRLQKAHRYMYALVVGPIPEGTEVDHTCHTKDCPTPGFGDIHRRCVNPSHLEAVTRSVNITRGQSPEITHDYYQREVTHCPHGHEYTFENTRIEMRGEYATRHCRACNRRRRHEFLAKRRELRAQAST